MDVTERKQSEFELEQAHSELSQVFENAMVGIFRTDFTGKILLVNPAILHIMGYDSMEAMNEVGLPNIYKNPSDRDKLMKMVDQGPVEGFETQVVRSDGKVIDIILTIYPVLEVDGQVSFLEGNLIDITDRKQAEQKIRDNEAALQKAQQIARLGFYDWDLRNDAVTASEGLRTFYGCEPDEALTFELVASRIHPEDRERFVQADLESRTQGVPFSMDYRVLLPDGTIRWAHDQSEVSVDEQGNKVRMFGIIQDITERMQTQLKLRDSEAHLSGIIRLAPVGICVMKDNAYVSVNDHFCETTGYSRDELIGEANRQISRKLYESDAEYEAVSQKIYEQIRDNGIVNIETRILRKDGTPVYNLVSGIPLDPDNLEKGILFAGLDITERYKAQKQLRFTQFAVDHAGEAAYWMGPDARFIYVNELACQSLGYTWNELLQLTVHDIDPDFPAEAWGDHWNEIKQKKSMRFESHHKRKDGTIFPVEITSNFVNYDGVEYNCAFVRNITNRKIAEQKREILMQQIHNRNDELQSIVFTAAHDLRSPLVNIAGFTGELEKGFKQLAEVLDGAPLTADVAERVDFLLNTDLAESLRFVKFGNQQLDMLLGGLMRLSRVGSVPMKTEVLDMNELFDAVVRGFQYQIKTLKIDVSIQKDLPDATGDYSLLAQVFINLLDNAIKYRHPDRAVVIEIAGAVQDDMAEFTITDNGIGIESAQVEVVFDLFHRLDHKPESDGEGLGLTIVRRILDRQNGTVRIDSTPDLGTTVYVRMPLA